MRSSPAARNRGSRKPGRQGDPERKKQIPPGVVPRPEIREDILGDRSLGQVAQGALRGEERRHDEGRDRKTGDRRPREAGRPPPEERPSGLGREGASERAAAGERHEQDDRLQGDAEARSEGRPEEHDPPRPRRSAHECQERREPRHDPQVVGSELRRPEEKVGVEAEQHRRPDRDPTVEQPRGDRVGEPERQQGQGNHGETHDHHGVRPLADQREERRQQDVEEGRVVVGHVAILEQAPRPPPHHVKVLRLVRVDAVVKDVRHPREGRRPEED